MTAKKHVLYFDLLNIVACICVVALHCNQMVHTWMPGKNWAAGLIIEVICYWAVPVFFMLTGATLMRYRDRYDTKTFLTKRFRRTVIPFLFWSTVLYFYIVIYRNGGAFGPRRMINAILNNEIEQIYWFFFPLFSVYLALPVLSLLSDNKKALTYMAGVSFLLVSVLPFACSAIGISWPGSISIPVCGGMLMFVILGFLLSETSIPKRTRMIIYALGVASMLFRYAYTYTSSNALGYVDRTYFDYMAFPSVILGVAVFVFFKHLDTTRLEPFSKQLSKLSGCSFGVYLIHKPILDFVIMDALGVPMTSVLLRTVGVIALYLICVSLVLLLKKIPVLREIVP